MNGDPVWFLFAGRCLVLRAAGDDGQVFLPRGEDALALGSAPPLDVSRGDLVALALELESDEPPEGFVLCGLREAHAVLPEPLWPLAGRALQLLEWRRDHRFCGRCGAPTEPHGSERAMACVACDRLHFPRVAPAVIVLVERDGRALLGRSPHFPPGVFSVLAGFVEPGESLEETVRREVAEEAGVRLGEVRYWGSQPWPFPHSLMVGFTATWAGGEVEPDGVEVVEAGWYGPDDLPVLPTSFSIARALIDDFVARKRRAH